MASDVLVYSCLCASVNCTKGTNLKTTFYMIYPWLHVFQQSTLLPHYCFWANAYFHYYIPHQRVAWSSNPFSSFHCCICSMVLKNTLKCLHVRVTSQNVHLKWDGIRKGFITTQNGASPWLRLSRILTKTRDEKTAEMKIIMCKAQSNQ